MDSKLVDFLPKFCVSFLPSFSSVSSFSDGEFAQESACQRVTLLELPLWVPDSSSKRPTPVLGFSSFGGSEMNPSLGQFVPVTLFCMTTSRVHDNACWTQKVPCPITQNGHLTAQTLRLRQLLFLC